MEIAFIESGTDAVALYYVICMHEGLEAPAQNLFNFSSWFIMLRDSVQIRREFSH